MSLWLAAWSTSQEHSSVHIPGVGDLRIKDVSSIPDPCPLPEQLKQRALNQQERLVYAPFSGLGGIVYDKDAIYIQSKAHKNMSVKRHELVEALENVKSTINDKLSGAKLTLLGDSVPIEEVINEEDDTTVLKSDDDGSELEEFSDEEMASISGHDSEDHFPGEESELTDEGIFDDDCDEDNLPEQKVSEDWEVLHERRFSNINPKSRSGSTG